MAVDTVEDELLLLKSDSLAGLALLYPGDVGG